MDSTKKTFRVRFFEILPGFLTWTTFIVPLFLAFYAPRFISIVVMIYALYWFFRTLHMSYYLILGYRHYREAMKIQWLHDLKVQHPKDWERVVHLVFVPMYKESYDILAPTIQALAQSDYDLKRIIPVICTEQRAGDGAQEVAKQLKKEFAHYFPNFYITTHPDNIVGEVKGKGANMYYAAHQVVPNLLKKYKADDVLVTTIDADNRVDRQYFACTTKAFLETPNPKHASFQPLPMYFNNIWDVPLFVRMIALGSSFWVMVEATRPDHLRNFSAHSQSLSGLLACDFWSTKTIVEDGHQYWRSLYRFHGEHYVVPVFVPVYQDAVLSSGLWDTIKEQYLQKKRWAWGVTDVAYVFDHNRDDHSMSFMEKWGQFLRLFEGHYSWATTSILLAVGGWPPLLINEAFQKTVFGYNFPFYYSTILTIAGIGMVISLVISTLILPPPRDQRHNHKLRLLIDWVLTPFLLPVTSIIFGSIPAIDSQTRLMFGKYLEYRVTVKKAVTEASTKVVVPAK